MSHAYRVPRWRVRHMPGSNLYPAMNDVGIVAVMYRVEANFPHLQFWTFLLSPL